MPLWLGGLSSAGAVVAACFVVDEPAKYSVSAGMDIQPRTDIDLMNST